MTPVQAAVSERSHLASELSHDPNPDPVCGPPKEKEEKEGREEDSGQGANHLQKIRDLFCNLKCPQF